jgi:hypothetical protein
MKTRPFNRLLREVTNPGSEMNRKLVGALVSVGEGRRFRGRLHPQALRTLLPGYHLSQKQALRLLDAIADSLGLPPS